MILVRFNKTQNSCLRDLNKKQLRHTTQSPSAPLTRVARSDSMKSPVVYPWLFCSTVSPESKATASPYIPVNETKMWDLNNLFATLSFKNKDFYRILIFWENLPLMSTVTVGNYSNKFNKFKYQSNNSANE